MRLFNIGLLTALFVPLAAYAQAAKQVEVTNLPAVQEVTGSVEVTNLPSVQDVNVVDAPPPTAPTRFQLVGFTSQAFPGTLGPLVLTLQCQAEFSKSRVCTYEEVAKTVNVSDLSVLVGEAWVLSPKEFAGGNAGFPSFCPEAQPPVSWGFIVDQAGRARTTLCTASQPIACCALVP